MTASPCLVRQNFPSSLFRGLSFKFFAWIQKTDMKPCAHTETCYLCQFAPTFIIGNTDQSFRLTAEIPNFNEFQACQGQLIHDTYTDTASLWPAWEWPAAQQLELTSLFGTCTWANASGQEQQNRQEKKMWSAQPNITPQLSIHHPCKSPRSCVAFKICKCSTWIHVVRRQQNWKFRIPNLPWNNTNKVQFLHFASATAVLYTFPFTYARWKRWTHWKRLCSTNWQLATPSVPWTACRKWIAAVSRCAPCTRLSVPAACMKHLGSEHALQPCLEQGGDLLPFLRPAALLV